MGLGERADHLPRALSGGERQRVAIARAAANDPRLILADEPSGNLDDESTALVLDLLDELVRGRGCTFVVATHDRAVAARADRRLRLENGSLTTPMIWRDACVFGLRSMHRRLGRVVLTMAAVALAAALLSALLIAVGAARTRVLSAVSKGGPLTGIEVFPNAADVAQLGSDSAKLGAARPIDDATVETHRPDRRRRVGRTAHRHTGRRHPPAVTELEDRGILAGSDPGRSATR